MRRIVLASLLAVQPIALQARPVPVEAFAEYGAYTSPRLSPDGKHIALNVRIDRDGRSVPTLHIYSLPDMKLVSAMGMKGWEMLLGFSWLNNKRLVARKGIELGLGEAPYSTGELVAFDLDGANFRYLYGYKNYRSSIRGEQYNNDYGYAYVNTIPDAGDGHVIADTALWDSGHSTLYDIDSMSANRKLLAKLNEKYMTFVLQDEKLPRYAYGSDVDNNRILYRLDDKQNWVLAGTEAEGKDLIPIRLNANGTEMYAWQIRHDKPYSLVHFDIKSGKRKILASDEFSSLSTILTTGYPHYLPFAAFPSAGVPKVQYLLPDADEAKLHKLLSAQFPGAVVEIGNFTRDSRKVLFNVASDREPVSYYLFDRDTGKADLLFTNFPMIYPEDMASRTPVRFKARDGLELEAIITMPKDSAGKKVPVVVHPHGGPHGPYDSWYFDADAQFLANRGYAVVQVNFRGSGGRGEQFERMGFREWGGKMMDDIVDGLKHVTATMNVDPNRVCTYGVSFGAYAATMLPTREPSMFKCAVGYAGLYDLPLIYKEESSLFSKRIKNFHKKAIGEDPAELARYSPARQADKLRVPVLLIHGEHDEITPIIQFETMEAALKEQNRPPETMRVEKEGHGFYKPENRKAMLERLEAFLKKHIGT